jgi:two-component system, NarL family, response regulator LiaR
MTGVKAAPVTDGDEWLSRRIRVLVVDENAAVRHALSTFLAAFDDLVLAGQAANGKEATRLCACTHPDIVLLDATLPDMSGAAATRAILERSPCCRVIGICTFQEEALIPEVLGAGAVGYLLKNVSADELANAIRTAHAGHGPSAEYSRATTTS